MPPEENLELPAASAVEETQNTATLTPDAATAGASEDPSTTETKPETPAAKTFTQEELDKIVQKRVAKERSRIERLASVEAENRMLREQIQPKAQPIAPASEPAPEQFKTYEEYISALTDWKVDQKLNLRSKADQEREQQRAEQQHTSSIHKRLEEGSSKYDDFDEVVRNPAVPITKHMAEAFGDSDVGADIAYYLGSNIEEAKRISALAPAAQIRAIIGLESKFPKASAAAPIVSKAPKPIEPITSGKAPTTGLSDSLSADEWAKRRNAELAKRR